MNAAPAGGPRWQPATITRIDRHTPRVVSIFLSSPLARSVAGQHLDVRLTADDGYAAERSYSIASAPGAALTELAIEQLHDGEVSAYFHDVAQIGDDIDVRGPIGGHFAWRANDGGPLLLIGGGSGVAPLMAIARERAQVAATVPALLLYSSRTWDEVMFRDELLAMDAVGTAFTLRLAITRGDRSRPQDLAQRLDRQSLAAALREWGRAPAHVYVCGSNTFVESVTTALVADGMPAPIVRTERFGGAAQTRR